MLVFLRLSWFRCCCCLRLCVSFSVNCVKWLLFIYFYLIAHSVCFLIKIQMRCGQWEYVHFLFLSGLDANTWKSVSSLYKQPFCVCVWERSCTEVCFPLPGLTVVVLVVMLLRENPGGDTQGSVWLWFSLAHRHTATHTLTQKQSGRFRVKGFHFVR